MNFGSFEAFAPERRSHSRRKRAPTIDCGSSWWLAVVLCVCMVVDVLCF